MAQSTEIGSIHTFNTIHTTHRNLRSRKIKKSESSWKDKRNVVMYSYIGCVFVVYCVSQRQRKIQYNNVRLDTVDCIFIIFAAIFLFFFLFFFVSWMDSSLQQQCIQKKTVYDLFRTYMVQFTKQPPRYQISNQKKNYKWTDTRRVCRLSSRPRPDT